MGIGKVIKEYREVNGLSLREFAEKTGLSHAYIDKLENGKDPVTRKPVTPTMRTINMIAIAMRKTPEELMSAAGYLDDENIAKPKTPDGVDMFFMRAVGKLSPEGKKKIYDYIEMVDAIEKQKKKK